MSSVSRRAFLATPIALAIGATTTGCTTPPAPVLIDPDREALEAALAVERVLLADTESWTGQALVSRDDVTAVLQVHVERLVSTLGTAPSTSASTTGTPTPQGGSITTQVLRSRALRAAASHTRASRPAGPQTAQLLASLAASDAAIAAALTEPT